MTSISDHAWGASLSTDIIWSKVCGLRPGEAGKQVFMVLQAYIDDSTDDQNSLHVFAGYVATAENWAAFSAEWEKMLPLGTLSKSGGYHFKMSEMAALAERMDRVPAFHAIINRHVIMSISCSIYQDDIDRASKRLKLNGDDRVKLQFETSPHILLYLSLMNNFHQMRLENPDRFPIGGPVDFYFDQMNDTKKIYGGWDSYIASTSEDLKQLYGSPPRFEDDELFLPLQAADFRAWWIRKFLLEAGRDNKTPAFIFPYQVNARTVKHMHWFVSEDNLVEYHMEGFKSEHGFHHNLVDVGSFDIKEEFPLQKGIKAALGSLKKLFSLRPSPVSRKK